MRRGGLLAAVAIALSVGTLATGVAGQESRPAPGGGPPGAMESHGMMGGTMMMCHPMMMGGGMPGMSGMPGGAPAMPGGPGAMPGMGGMMGVMTVPGGDPKAAARALRLRADMLKAMSDVLQRHAAELEKGQ